MSEKARCFDTPDGSLRIVANRDAETLELRDPASGAAFAVLQRTLLVGRPDFHGNGNAEFDVEAPSGKWRVRVHPDRTFITHPHDMESRPLADLATELGAVPGPAIARKAPPVNWWACAGSAGFVAIGLWMAVAAHSGKERLAGAGCAAVFGGVLVMHMRGRS